MSRPLSPKKESELNRLPSRAKRPHAAPLSARKLPKLAQEICIYHDTDEERARYRRTAASPEPTDDKENVLQPKGTAPRRHGRTPLAPLSIHEFPGFCASGSVVPRARLLTLYHPPTAQNESRSLHKFSGVQSFVSPPRSRPLHVLNEDELEERLARKARSLSVGANRGKRGLVLKPAFRVLKA